MENESKNFDLFLYMLALMFIGFKLSGVIDWSWFWVLSPLILPTIIAIVVIFVAFGGIFVYYVLEDFFKRKRK